MAEKGFKMDWDRMGMATSVACAIHCAVLPLFFTSLPLLGVNIVHNEAFEFGMIFLALVIGVIALKHGWKKHHHSSWPVALFIAGISLLFLKQWFEEHFIYILIPAVVLILSAHFLNFRLCREHGSCSHKEHCHH